jgi:Leucine-rich repeat (LRR) protein
MNLNTDLLYLIVQQYPTLALASTNKEMHAYVHQVFDAASKFIEKELTSLKYTFNLKDTVVINKMKYFTKLTDGLYSEAKHLGISHLNSDPSKLSAVNRMIWGYFHFIKLIEQIKLETQQAQQEDFNKFVKIVANAVNQTILPYQNFKEIWKRIKKNHLEKRVESLNLAKQNMKFLPPEIGDLTNLKNLNLNNNQLNSLPVEINSLSLLKSLSLNNNEITDVSNELKLPNLQELELRYNNLEQVPDLNSFPNLKAIYLHHNKIKNIPPVSTIDSHPSLEFIYLKENPITIPPTSFPSRIVHDHMEIELHNYHANDRFEDV